MLSQQAHFSTFSKEIIYSKYEDSCFMFDSVFRSTLNIVLILLNKMHDGQPTSDAVQYLVDTLWAVKRETTRPVS